MIRCAPHDAVRQLNASAADGGECGACIAQQTVNAILNRITVRMVSANIKKNDGAGRVVKAIVDLIREDYKLILSTAMEPLLWPPESLCDGCGKPKHVNCDCE